MRTSSIGIVPRLALLLGLALVASCGPKTVFGLTSDDNNADALGKALAVRKLPTAPQVRNSTGRPLVLAVASGSPKKLVAWDADAGKALWTVDADVQSRVAVAGDLVVAREGTKVVVRNVNDGKQRGAINLGGELVGATTDGELVYVTWQSQGATRPVWTIAAYSPDGGERWRNDAPGALGAPSAQGGLVFSPFLKQWLAVLDARTGAQLTRVRGIDEEIAFVRTTSDATWFGSKAGIFRLDTRAASGTRAGSTYGTTTLPPQLASATYARDAFDPVQAGYTAYDRKRVLWRAAPAGDTFAFEGDTVAVHFFRFVFGLTRAGELQWAYSHPRVELVASEHAGGVVVAIGADGSLVALDPATGATRASQKLDVGGQILGATFDCDGWAPAGDGEPPATVQALVAIARDRDRRFDEIKQYAVQVLARLEGADVAKDLLAIVQDGRTPAKLRESVIELLVARKDPKGLPALLVALEPRYDYITGAEPAAVGVIARAIGGLGERDVADAERARAVKALVAHADDPATSTTDRLEVVRAMIAIGRGSERAWVRSQLVLERADPAFAREEKLVEVMVASLAAGGPEDRETLRYVATDARSAASVAQAARAALAAK
ncbi:MAG: PQQ-binding-like beta-propeller repeat protein [Deltaproteobacteria bacterium]|nr:PQQ-binding-like beta-propeller repeat protein [Kofleriaceae bacterium]